VTHDGVDVRRVMNEIHDEVRRRRATGELPPELEQELDTVFARFAPAGAVEEDFADLLDKVERASFVDPNPPVASNLPGGQAVKNAVRRATGFAIQHLSVQISAFDHAAVRALRRLDQRVRAVEDAPAFAPSWDIPVDVDEPDLAAWADRIADRVGGASGRVLHADAGAGALVARLRAGGLDSYGTEPTQGSAGRAPEGVEIREAAALEHLAVLSDHVLGGLVLSGCVDRLPREEQLALVGRAAQVLRPGAPLVVVGTHPEIWVERASPVVRDLADGRPLHAETWAHVIGTGPFTPPDVVHEEGSATYFVHAARI
jgi:hypothetical protein